MKRFFVLMTAAVLFLSVACAAAAETFSTSYFSLDLPDGWEIDTTDLEKKENEESLGFFAGKMGDVILLGGAYLVYYEDLKDISLWNSGEFVYADTVTNGYSIQFEFYATDSEGEKELPITEEHIEQIKTILASFKPAA